MVDTKQPWPQQRPSFRPSPPGMPRTPYPGAQQPGLTNIPGMGGLTREERQEAQRLAELALRQQEAEEQAKARQRAEDMKKLQAYVQELSFFSDGVALHKLERTKLEEERAEQARIREEERRRRREQRRLSSH